MKTKTFIQIGLTAFMILLSMLVKAQEGMHVVGYVTDGSLSSYYDQIDFCKVTTLNVSFCNPDAQGNLSFDIDLTDEIAYARQANPNMKVYASLAGGADSRNETTLSYYKNLLSPANRAGFIAKIVSFLKTEGYDGMDVDLEGPGIFNGYNEFTIELADALHAEGLDITVALPWFLPGLVSDQALRAYDYINIMAYDDGGSWTTNPKQHSSMAHMQKCIDYWVNTKGIAKDKLTVGVPFYGYTWNVSPATGYTYRSAADQGYADVDQFGSAWHNGRPTMRQKVESIYNQDMLGLMIWQLGQDHFGEYSLLTTIDEKIKDLGTFTNLGCDDDGNNTYIPEDDPIAYFPFETDVLDYSTAGKDFDSGTNDGATIVVDNLRGNVMDFDGTGMVTVQTGNGVNDGLPSRKEITVSTWVKTESAHEWGGFVGSFQDNGAEESGWILGTRNQKFSVGLTGSDGTINYMSDNQDFELNKWYHVAMTYDGTTIRLFVNGVEVNSVAESGKLFYLNSGWFQIGSYKDNNEDNRHNGLLDDVKIWERALTKEEVDEEYKGSIITSNGDVSFNSLIGVYPNPGKEFISIKGYKSGMEISIIDAIGHEVFRGTENRINVEQLSSGMYYIKADYNGVINIQSWIKK